VFSESRMIEIDIKRSDRSKYVLDVGGDAAIDRSESRDEFHACSFI